MYLDYYQLEKYPFHVTPDPEFLFLGPSHREALASVIYGVEEKKGFIAILGEVGVGKTTILRSYLEKVEKDQLKTIYVFHADISFKELLKTICRELDISLESEDLYDIVPKLHEALIEEYRQGHAVVLIIDEAQNMPINTLENLRMLSNLETTEDKLIQIILCGQPEFEEMLQRRELLPLNQRISIKARISPLSIQDSRKYIRHRLSKAGRKGAPLFTNDALKGIVDRAKGIPRTINILCDNCLVTAFGSRKDRVNGKIVKEILQDHYGKKNTGYFRWGLIFLSFLIIIAGGYFLYQTNDPAVFYNPWRSANRASDLPPPLKEEAENAYNGTRGEGGVIQTESDSGKETMPAPETGYLQEQESLTGDARKSFPMMRRVKKGDTISGMGVVVYGSIDDRMINRIKEVNPWIRDPDVIHEGNIIIFPEFHATAGRESRKR
jgi:general secretion pathway protein A